MRCLLGQRHLALDFPPVKAGQGVARRLKLDPFPVLVVGHDPQHGRGSAVGADVADQLNNVARLAVEELLHLGVGRAIDANEMQGCRLAVIGGGVPADGDLARSDPLVRPAVGFVLASGHVRVLHGRGRRVVRGVQRSQRRQQHKERTRPTMFHSRCHGSSAFLMRGLICHGARLGMAGSIAGILKLCSLTFQRVGL